MKHERFFSLVTLFCGHLSGYDNIVKDSITRLFQEENVSAYELRQMLEGLVGTLDEKGWSLEGVEALIDDSDFWTELETAA